MAFLERIHALAEQRGTNLTDVAKRAGLSRTTLYAAAKREKKTGHANVDNKTARKLAEALRITPSELLDIEPVDTLSMARDAAALMTTERGLDPDDAWMLMRDLDPPAKASVVGYFEAAKAELQRRENGRPSGSPSVPPNERQTVAAAAKAMQKRG